MHAQTVTIQELTIDFSPGEPIQVIPVGTPVDLDNPGFFGVRNGAFEINDIEGRQCTPPFSLTNGMNDSRAFVISEPARANYCNVAMQLFIRLSDADFEPCLNRSGVNPVGCTDFTTTGPGGDGVTVEVRLGNTVLFKGGYCGENAVGQFSIVNQSIKIGDVIALLITGGTQAPDESYYIDQLLVVGQQQSFTGAVLNAPKVALCAGRDVLIINEVTNGRSYRWEKDGKSLSETGSNITRSPVTLDDAGQYTVIMEEAGGCISTASIAITVDECNMIPLFNFDPVFCQGDSLSLSNTSDNNITGTWSYNNVSLADTSGQIVLQFRTGTSSYPYTITVLPVLRDTLVLPACYGENILLNEQVYSLKDRPSGNDTLVSSSGCDSILTVTLIPDIIIDTTTYRELLCPDEVRIINGVLYDQDRPSGVDTIRSESGCDTIVFVDYRWISTDSIYSTVDVCEGDSLFMYNTWINDRSDMLMINAGPNNCDSLFIINVNVLMKSRAFLDLNLCPGQDTIIHGTTFNTEDNISGQIVLNGSDLCDSILYISVNVLSDITLPIDTTICPTDTLVVGSDKFYFGKKEGSVVLQSSSGCDSIVQVQLNFWDQAVTEIKGQYCSGDTVEINGELFYASKNTSSQYFSTANGCDSIVDIRLTFLDYTETIITGDQPLCPSDVRIVNDRIYDVNHPKGRDTLISSSGCDSVVIVDFTFISPDTLEISLDLCKGDTIDYNGFLLEESMLGQSFLFGPNGCDTVLFINLNIIDITPSLSVIDLCTGTDTMIGGVLFDPINKTDGIALYSSIGGCDSLVNIIINPLFDTILTSFFDICEFQSIMVGTETFNILNTSGQVRLLRSNGCDSIIDVNVKVIPNDTIVIMEELCSNDFRIVGNTRYDIMNPKGTEVMMNQRGCDSLIRVELSFMDVITTEIDTSICSGESLLIGGQVFSGRVPADTLKFTSAQGCDSLIIVSISEVPLPMVSLKSDTLDCKNQRTVSLTAETEDRILRWTGPNGFQSDSVSPLVSIGGTYKVDIINGAGCWIQDSLIVYTDTVKPELSLILIPGITCQNAGAQLQAITDEQMVKWWYEDMRMEIMSKEQFVYNEGNYKVEVVGSNGCMQTDSIDIMFQMPEISISSVKGACKGLDNGRIIIDKISALSYPIRIYLMDGDELVLNELPTEITDLSVGDNMIIAEDDKGCTVQVTFTINPSRPGNLAILSDQIDAGVWQLGLNSDLPIEDIYWKSDSDLSCDSCSNPIISGTDTIVVIAEAVDADGCLLSDSLFLFNELKSQVYLPNIFSPSSTLGNNRFYPQSNYRSPIFFDLSIYDRWGTLVYFRENQIVGDSSSGWDGTLNGLNAESGVYFYIVRIYDASGLQLEKRIDSITLIR